MSLSATKQWLQILHTNDIHSHFEQMPKVAAAMDALSRSYRHEQALRIDCGDHMDQMRLETEGSNGLANVDLMNETGYDYAVLGNNEGLTFSQEDLARLFGEHARFTTIGSNFYDGKTAQVPSWAVPYEVAHKGDLTVGLIGVTANFTDFYTLLGWDVKDPFATVQKLTEELRPKVHVLIVISHLGLAHDKRIAEQIEGIDLILGAHTHHLLDTPLLINHTHVCGAGKFGQHVGEVLIEYDFSLRKISKFKGRCIDVGPYPDSERIARRIAVHKRNSEEYMSRQVTVLDQRLANLWHEESPLGNLLAEGLRSWTNAEVGLVNAGQLLYGLEAGKVTSERLLEICPSPVNPCSMLLTGKQIWQALEESLLQEYIEMPIRGFGFRGKQLGTLCVDGLSIEYDESRPPYEKILHIWIRGQPFDKTRDYLVGTIDMFTFGVGYISLRNGRNIRYCLPEFIRDVLQKQLLDPQAVGRSHNRRWKAIK